MALPISGTAYFKRQWKSHRWFGEFTTKEQALVVMGPGLEIPVTDLFAAAIIPGIMLASLYAGYTTLRCYLNPKLGPVLPASERPKNMGKVWYEFFMGLVPPAALVFFALGSILFGLATPTEGALQKMVFLYQMKNAAN